MFSVINPLAGADRLLHGSENLKGWGQPDRPDGTLLYVRGFDRFAQRYVYEVNERFGDTQSARTAIRNPFQSGMQVRMQLGPDRQREMLMGALAGMGGRGAAGGFDVRTIVERIAPNPIAAILELRDSLGLTPQQVTSLQLIGDSLRARTDSLIAVVQRQVDSLGTGADLPRVFPLVQPRLQEGRDAYLRAIESARGVLRPEQWEKLPDSSRNPVLRRVPGGRRDRPLN